MKKKYSQGEKNVTGNTSMTETEKNESPKDKILVSRANDQPPVVHESDLNIDKVILIVDLLLEIAGNKIQQKAG